MVPFCSDGFQLFWSCLIIIIGIFCDHRIPNWFVPYCLYVQAVSSSVVRPTFRYYPIFLWSCKSANPLTTCLIFLLHSVFAFMVSGRTSFWLIRVCFLPPIYMYTYIMIFFGEFGYVYYDSVRMWRARRHPVMCVWEEGIDLDKILNFSLSNVLICSIVIRFSVCVQWWIHIFLVRIMWRSTMPPSVVICAYGWITARNFAQCYAFVQQCFHNCSQPCPPHQSIRFFQFDRRPHRITWPGGVGRQCDRLMFFLFSIWFLQATQVLVIHWFVYLITITVIITTTTIITLIIAITDENSIQFLEELLW